LRDQVEVAEAVQPSSDAHGDNCQTCHEFACCRVGVECARIDRLDAGVDVDGSSLAIWGYTERDSAFGDDVGAFTPRVDELVEVLVER
jgi:hypothetical protein